VLGNGSNSGSIFAIPANNLNIVVDGSPLNIEISIGELFLIKTIPNFNNSVLNNTVMIKYSAPNDLNIGYFF